MLLLLLPPCAIGLADNRAGRISPCFSFCPRPRPRLARPCHAMPYHNIPCHAHVQAQASSHHPSRESTIDRPDRDRSTHRRQFIVILNNSTNQSRETSSNRHGTIRWKTSTAESAAHDGAMTKRPSTLALPTSTCHHTAVCPSQRSLLDCPRGSVPLPRPKPHFEGFPALSKPLLDKPCIDLC